MGVLDKLLGAVQMNTSEDEEDDITLEEDFSEDEEEELDDDLFDEEVPNKKFVEKFKNKRNTRVNQEAEQEEDEDDEPAEEPRTREKKTTESFFRKAPKQQKKAEKKESSSRTQARPGKSQSRSASSKITSIHSNKRSAGSEDETMEVCVIKPSSMEDTKEIADALVDGCVVMLNLEALDIELAQRIIDFASGACYSLDGKLTKISSYIFVLGPEGVVISGDFQNLLPGTYSTIVRNEF